LNPIKSLDKKMSDCECLQKCAFFNDKVDKLPALSNILKRDFCRGDKNKCARYLLFSRLGPQSVPNYLYPTDKKQAKKILRTHALIKQEQIETII